MTRRTFVKKMMALGFSRNAINTVTKYMLIERDERRKNGEKIRVTWSYIYSDTLWNLPTKSQIDKFNRKWGRGGTNENK